MIATLTGLHISIEMAIWVAVATVIVGVIWTITQRGNK